MKKTNKDFTSAFDESFLGFPIGKVAQSIRKVISPKFSNHDVESITIILVSHLMIEREINALLLKWMTGHLPEMSTKTKNDISVNDLALEELEKVINKLDFEKKLNRINREVYVRFRERLKGRFLWSTRLKLHFFCS